MARAQPGIRLGPRSVGAGVVDVTETWHSERCYRNGMPVSIGEDETLQWCLETKWQ